MFIPRSEIPKKENPYLKLGWRVLIDKLMAEADNLNQDSSLGDKVMMMLLLVEWEEKERADDRTAAIVGWLNSIFVLAATEQFPKYKELALETLMARIIDERKLHPVIREYAALILYERGLWIRNDPELLAIAATHSVDSNINIKTTCRRIVTDFDSDYVTIRPPRL